MYSKLDTGVKAVMESDVSGGRVGIRVAGKTTYIKMRW